VDRFSDSEKPFTWEKVFIAPGVYTITAIVTDDFGAVSQPARIDLEVTQKRFFILADKLVPDTLDFVISGGGGLALKGDPWRSFFMANLMFNVHSGPAYFGAGAGFTTKVKSYRNSDAEIIGNIGGWKGSQFL